MGKFKNFFNFSRKKSVDNSVSERYNAAPDFGGSRITVPKFFGGRVNGIFMSLPKRTQQQLSLDDRRLKTMSVSELIDALIDAHPDVSFAVWNFLRIGNSGYNITVEKLGSKTRYISAEKDINSFLDSLDLPGNDRFEKTYSLKKIINQLFLGVITRGAACLEVVLTPDRKDVAFLAPVDPTTIDFRLENDRYVPYQNLISLDIPTFFYEGLDERVDDPYGRSPILSALNMVLFQLQVLNDIKAVVHSQGYPRFDINVVEEVLLRRMPISIRNNEAEKQRWLGERLSEIINTYNDLEPDDTFVHFDSVNVGMVGGGSSGGAVIDPQKLMAVIDNLIMSGLKTLSTILGRRSTGNTESFAKMEIKLYLQGVKAIQDVVSQVLSRALTLVLNMKGKQGKVKLEFIPVEIRTELEQEQFKQIKYINLAFARDQGWISQDEAANAAVGHTAISEPNWEHLQPIKNKDGETPKGSIDINEKSGGGNENGKSMTHDAKASGLEITK